MGEGQSKPAIFKHQQQVSDLTSVATGDIQADDLEVLRNRCQPKAFRTVQPSHHHHRPDASGIKNGVGGVPMAVADAPVPVQYVPAQAAPSPGPQQGSRTPIAPIPPALANFGASTPFAPLPRSNSMVVTTLRLEGASNMQRSDSMVRTGTEQTILAPQGGGSGVYPMPQMQRSDSMVRSSGCPTWQEMQGIAMQQPMIFSQTAMQAPVGAMQRSPSWYRTQAQQAQQFGSSVRTTPAPDASVGAMQRSSSWYRTQAQQAQLLGSSMRSTPQAPAQQATVATMQRSSSMYRTQAEQGVVVAAYQAPPASQRTCTPIRTSGNVINQDAHLRPTRKTVCMPIQTSQESSKVQPISTTAPSAAPKIGVTLDNAGQPQPTAFYSLPQTISDGRLSPRRAATPRQQRHSMPALPVASTLMEGITFQQPPLGHSPSHSGTVTVPQWDSHSRVSVGRSPRHSRVSVGRSPSPQTRYTSPQKDRTPCKAKGPRAIDVYTQLDAQRGQYEPRGAERIGLV